MKKITKLISENEDGEEPDKRFVLDFIYKETYKNNIESYVFSERKLFDYALYSVVEEKETGMYKNPSWPYGPYELEVSMGGLLREFEELTKSIETPIEKPKWYSLPWKETEYELNISRRNKEIDILKKFDINNPEKIKKEVYKWYVDIYLV